MFSFNIAKPEPFVRWYEGSTLLDDEIDHMVSEHRFKNEANSEEEEEKEKEEGQRKEGGEKEQFEEDPVNVGDGSVAVSKRLVKRMYYSQLIKFEYQHGLTYMTNTLFVEGKLTRKDFRRKFKCLAGNTQLVPPIEKEVTLDMQCMCL